MREYQALLLTVILILITVFVLFRFYVRETNTLLHAKNLEIERLRRDNERLKEELQPRGDAE